MCFPGGSAVKNPPGNAGDVGLIPGWEDPLEKEMAVHCQENSMDRKNLAGYGPWGHKRDRHDLAAKTTTKPKIIIENFLLYLVMMYHLFSLLLDSIF